MLSHEQGISNVNFHILELLTLLPCFANSPSASQPWPCNGLSFLLGAAASKAAALGTRLGFQTVILFNFEQISF